MKVITIIVPTYNMEALLEKDLASLIIANRQERVEVIVVNDGSKDNSLSIAMKLHDKYPHIFNVINKENGNYGSCINVALKAAKGKYVKIMDADDSFDTENFEKLVDYLEHSDVDMILTSYTEIYLTGTHTRKDINLESNKIMTFSDFCNNKIFHDLIMHTVTYKAEIFKHLNYHQAEGIYYTDNQWVFKPLAAVKVFVYLNIPIYKYLLGREGQSISEEIKSTHTKDYILMICALIKDFADLSCSDYDKRNINFLYKKLYIKIKVLYKDYLVRKTYSNLSELKILDNTLKKYLPKMYQEIGKILLSKPLLCVRYISLWRKKGNCKLLQIVISLYQKKKRFRILGCL